MGEVVVISIYELTFISAKDIASRFGPFCAKFLALRPLPRKQLVLMLNPVYVRVGAILKRNAEALRWGKRNDA